MVVGEMPEGVDFVVIGAGPGGYTAALEAAGLGRQVLLIDTHGGAGAGGVCLLEGCIPSKALIRLADAASRSNDDTEMGLSRTGAVSIDLTRFQSWKGNVITALGDGVRGALARAGVEVVTGTASIMDDTTIRVEHAGSPSRIYRFEDLVIATGSTSVMIPAIDHTDARVVDAAGVLTLTEIPARAAVIGAGYIGIELGTALAKLGSDVTIVEAQEQVLPGLDARAAREVARSLRGLGVRVLVRAQASGLTETGLSITTDDGIVDIEADLIVVAVGRRPATASLLVERARLTLAPTGHIEVGDDLRCARHIAAIGDVVAGPGLAHKAAAEARVAVRALCGQKVRADHVVPLVVFSDPEVAAVGMSLAAARVGRPSATEVTVPLARAGRSLVEQRSHGFATLVFDHDSREVLGATLCGAHATEIIAEVTVAIEGGLSVDDLALIVHPHPTISEIIWEAARAAQPTERKHAS